MRREFVVKGSDIPMTLNFTNSDGGVIDLRDVNGGDFFLVKFFRKNGERIATYDSRAVDVPSSNIQLPNDDANWQNGTVNLVIDTDVTSNIDEGDIYCQLQTRVIEALASDGFADSFSDEIYVFTLTRSI